MTSAKDAIIMCRVSSAKQNTGNSLSEQEAICKAYCQSKNLVGGLSPEEKGKLEDWINESEEHRLLFYKIKKQLKAPLTKDVRNLMKSWI